MNPKQLIILVVLPFFIGWGCTDGPVRTYESQFNELETQAYELNLELVRVKKGLQVLQRSMYKLRYRQDSLIISALQNRVAPVDTVEDSVAVAPMVPTSIWGTIPNPGDSTARWFDLVEQLSGVMGQLAERESYIDQVYFLAEDGWTRIFPFLDTGVLKLEVPDTTSVLDYKRFYLPEEGANPDLFYWQTSPYLDPLGRGWIISCALPMVLDSTLVGWWGLDISMQRIRERLTASQQDAMLVSKEGVIVVSGDAAAERAASLELPEHRYLEPYRFQTTSDEAYTLYASKHSTVRTLAEAVIHEEQKQGSYTWNGTKYTLIATDISELNWKLVRIFPDNL